MSYEQTVEASHRTTFANSVQMVAQESASKIRSAVTILDDLSGESKNVRDLLSEADYDDGDDYDTENPENRSELDSVWLHRPTQIKTGETIYKADKFDLAMDPTSHFLRNKIKGVERGVWDRFLGIKKQSGGGFKIGGGGILGQRITGKDRTAADLPAGQYLPHGSAGMTLAKLMAGREALGLADFGLDDDISDELFCAITPKQITDLLSIATATGANLNQFELEQIKAYKPTTLLGATWMFTNRLPTDANDDRICPMWTKSNIGAGFWQDIQGSMWNLSGKQNLPYIFIDAYPAATRIEDEGVIVIPCQES